MPDRPLADARRRAEEALAEYDRLWGAAHATNAYGRAVVGLASALRALLASEPAKGAEKSTHDPDDCAMCDATETARIAAEERAAKAETQFSRLRQDRADALDVKTREGWSASEWIARTGKAERERREAQQALDAALLERDGALVALASEREAHAKTRATLAPVEALLAAGPEAKTPPVPITPPPCGGRCEDALDSRSPCPSCAERLAPPPAPEAPILPVCLECSFASGGHVHVNREDGSQAVRYPTAEEWNAAIRQAPPSDAVREAAEAVVRDDWWGHYCPCCGSTFKHGPECLIGRLAKALAEARAAKGGAE